MISTVGVEHPRFCDRTRCAHRGTVVHHRSAREVFLPRQDDTTDASVVQISIERLDEVDEVTGRQFTAPAEVILSDECGSRVRIGMGDLRELFEMVSQLHDRGIDRRLLMA